MNYKRYFTNYTIISEDGMITIIPEDNSDKKKINKQKKETKYIDEIYKNIDDEERIKDIDYYTFYQLLNKFYKRDYYRSKLQTI